MTSSSEKLFARAREVTPGGVNSPVRAFGAVGGVPRFMVRGSGPYLTDVDGREYADLVCSWGPMILGHAHPSVISAVAAALADGTSFGTVTPGEVELAEEIVARTPVEQVRLVNSGTADMVASVPELTRRTCSTGARATISSASSTSPGVTVPNEVPSARAADTAEMTAGWACPRIIGPHEQMRST